METEIKKRKHRKGGTDYAKEKLAKAEAENKTLKDLKTAADKFADEWKRRYDKKKEELETAEAKIEELEAQIEEANKKASESQRRSVSDDRTINQQAAKISELTAEIANLRGTARDYRCQFEQAVRRMGGFRRFIYGYNIPQFTDEDHWHD